jgi:hypothetical protein
MHVDTDCSRFILAARIEGAQFAVLLHTLLRIRS